MRHLNDGVLVRLCRAGGLRMLDDEEATSSAGSVSQNNHLLILGEKKALGAGVHVVGAHCPQLRKVALKSSCGIS